MAEGPGKRSQTVKSYEAALEAASENYDVDVVFAWVRQDGAWAVRAFAETPDAVLDFTEGREPLDREDYYRDLGIEEARLRRYSRLEYFTLVGEQGHLGPFDKGLFFAETSAADPLESLGT
ncbi:MAG: hypothetical protein PHV85_03500 [Desulfovibrionaceae bacterium]|nr:hypothetical protein [Desulfovibrionaceae bacterium]MDD4951596.1 hypothetical protein [Desulfovibrionaceae bacterium]